jgi:hypothetical protein
VNPLVKEWSAEAARKGLNPVEVLGELKDELKKRSAAF